MDITYNKVDETALPISINRVSASEYNQIAGSLMHIVNTSGLTPDVNDNGQLLAALQKLVGTAVVETYSNGPSWYRVWSDGWCEQGGYVPSGATSVTLLKPYANTNYNILMSSTYNGNSYSTNPTSVTTTSFNFVFNGNAAQRWKTCGYIN